MIIYADESYYTEYCGVRAPKLAENERTFYLRQASAYLNTIIRHKPSEPYPEEVKNACCDIAECICAHDARRGITSETTDGYSVSFDTAKGAETEAMGIAERWLAGTGLLYRG